MTQLSQIIAVRPTVKGKAERDLTNIYHLFQKPEPLTGIERSYRPQQEGGQELPPESTRVQVDVETKLADIRQAVTRMFDVQATLDWGNAAAKADVVVNGKTILKDVPATYLLFLEKQLVHHGTLLRKLPTLNPAEKWDRDAAANAWAADPTETVRTKKVPRNHVLAPATDKHAAQVQVWQEDIVEGFWKTRKFSGALPETRRRELVDRLDELVLAVKYAREQANTTVVTDQKVASKVFDYLFA